MLRLVLYQIVIAGNLEENENLDLLLSFVNKAGESSNSSFGNIGNQAGNGIISTSGGALVFTGRHAIEGNSLISLYKTDTNGEL